MAAHLQSPCGSTGQNKVPIGILVFVRHLHCVNSTVCRYQTYTLNLKGEQCYESSVFLQRVRRIKNLLGLSLDQIELIHVNCLQLAGRSDCIYRKTFKEADQPHRRWGYPADVFSPTTNQCFKKHTLFECVEII